MFQKRPRNELVRIHAWPKNALRSKCLYYRTPHSHFTGTGFVPLQSGGWFHCCSDGSKILVPWLRNTKNDLAVPLMRTLSGQKALSYGPTVVQKCGTSLTTISKKPPSVYSFKSRLR